jgi:hypothetical protein
MKLLYTLAAAAVASAQPVSYSRQVAPILAMNCHLCHGGNPDGKAGGLSTRTYADLAAGGNLGPVVVARDPARSPLYQFISGDRGEAHRMPLGGPPLPAAEIETIRRWIAEGATEDRADPPSRLTIPSVRMEGAEPLRIRARVAVESYVSLEVADSREARLYLDGGALRADGGVAARGRPGEWIEWTLRRAPDWPAAVRVTLTIEHPRSEPVRAELIAGDQRASSR